MTSLPTLARLRKVQQRLLRTTKALSETDLRTQFHPDLSAIGWHLGHCNFIENYWIHETTQNNKIFTQGHHWFYFPERNEKRLRGKRLPKLKKLFEQTEREFEHNLLLLAGTTGDLLDHPLFENEYLERFLVQHHCQHMETISMALTQRAIARHRHHFFPQRKLIAHIPEPEYAEIPEGMYLIGGDDINAYDNELPQHRELVKPFCIARLPVSNADYLSFIEHDGYNNKSLWGDEGWQWKKANGITQPNHWRKDARGWWYGLCENGPYELLAQDPVHGISHHEAAAFANWVGARLPHELEWEVATRSAAIADTGKVWEWCANEFYPYKGFKAFPYDEYSKPWFDGKHAVLRGASWYTSSDIRRPSFRNFYTKDKRHIFAGLRLAKNSDKPSVFEGIDDKLIDTE